MLRKEFVDSLNIFEQKQMFFNDERLENVKHTSYAYTIKQYESLEQWEVRKQQLKEKILMSSGFYGLDLKSELNYQIYDRTDIDDFIVYKVIFESQPGFYVTGNLYLPQLIKGLIPAVMVPHGHAASGRLAQSELRDYPLLCANFAKMGYAAFGYDMIGYNDSMQFKHESMGFEEELWGIGIFGLQLLNSIRGVDFLASLPYVDANNIACTGASGGGTQTFFLAALDDRIKVAAPVNMVSAHMQGGCYCENIAGLRLHTNNVEIASMIAPRSMLLVSCTGDWTCNTPEVEYPAIQSVYKLYDAESEIAYYYDDAPHNYNKNARQAVYAWVRKRLLGITEEWIERSVDFGNLQSFRLFPDNISPKEHKAKKELLEWIKTRKKTYTHKLWYDINNSKDILLKHLRHIFDINDKVPEDVLDSLILKAPGGYSRCNKEKVVDNFKVTAHLLCTNDEKAQFPVVAVRKNTAENKKKAFILVYHEGKKALFEDEKYHDFLKDILEEGHVVISPDLFLTGEYNYPGCSTGRVYPSSKSFTTFNQTDDALKVKDIVSTYNWVTKGKYEEIILGGFGIASIWCIAALPFLKDIKEVILDVTSFNPEDEREYIKSFYVPGFLAMGGFETCLRISSTKRIALLNEGKGKLAEMLTKAYDYYA